MDGTRTMTEIRNTFRTPLRILVPKILKSRDHWKAKSDTRKAQLRSAKVGGISLVRVIPGFLRSERRNRVLF